MSLPQRVALLAVVWSFSACVAFGAQIALHGVGDSSPIDSSSTKDLRPGEHLEFPEDPPGRPDAIESQAVSPGAMVTRGQYTSIQVNVDAAGNNILGDAANEPSIAVDPTDPSRIVMGWRQFDTVTSDFRQAGWAYSHDAGLTWTFPGVLDPGRFRSDPVLDSDADGNFYYYSLTGGFSCDLFKSTDGGVSWGPKVPAFGGDKPWIAIDRTFGIGRGNIYAMYWQHGFTRSTDGGVSFPAEFWHPLRNWPWGTLSVGPSGALYLVDGNFTVAKSTDAQDPSATPTFSLVGERVLPFVLRGSYPPNPGGLLGQAWVATDHSYSSSRGNVYVLGSGGPVLFSRSTDGGSTWSDPVHVTDDQLGRYDWAWFGTMSVAPNGRIDVIWNDTRNTGFSNLSELFYAFSVDQGDTWSANVPISPVFDSHIGWPNGQRKIGDYYDMVSDNRGANLAWAATFNGEQDVYFLRIPHDCNSNGESDTIDIENGTSADCNDNLLPDECEPNEDCNNNMVSDICDIAAGASADCNGNSVPDACDIALAASADCNGNEIPDECDMAYGASTDCNLNGTPDECDVAGGGSADCNINGVPDECDIDSATSLDCDADGRPDECDLADGTSADCNSNGLLDECDVRPEFPEHAIPTTTDYGPTSIFAADLDSDGDIDLLSAFYNDDVLGWYENTDGKGLFGPLQLITVDPEGTWSVFAADLDGDGDTDVLSTSLGSSPDFISHIVWYENTNGLGAFGPPRVITTVSHGISVFAADLDGDADIDVLSASSFDDKIAWYENTDGLGTFGPQRVITTAADGASSVFATDLDGDGDVDVLSASKNDDKIAWYENTDGLGTFGPQQVVTTAAIRAESVSAADLDGDGDTDVLSTSTGTISTIAWYDLRVPCFAGLVSGDKSGSFASG